MRVNNINTANFTGRISINKALVPQNCPYADKIKTQLSRCFGEIMKKTPDNVRFVPESLDYTWNDKFFGFMKKKYSSKKYLKLNMFDAGNGKKFSYPILVSDFVSGKRKDVIKEFEDCNIEGQLSKFAEKIVKTVTKNGDANYTWADNACKKAFGRNYNKIG